MDLKNLKNDNFLGYMVPALTFLIIVALVPTIIWPQLQRIKEKSATIKAEDQVRVRLGEKLDALSKIDQDDLDSKLANAEIALPSGKGLAPLVEGIKKISAQSNMILNSIKLKPGKIATASAKSATTTTTTTPVSTVKNNLVINVEVKGVVSDFQKFLGILEKAKRIVLVESFSSSMASDGRSTYSLILNAPFKPIASNAADQVAADLPSENDNVKVLYNRLSDEFIEYSTAVSPCDNCTGNVTNPFP